MSIQQAAALIRDLAAAQRVVDDFHDVDDEACPVCERKDCWKDHEGEE